VWDDPTAEDCNSYRNPPIRSFYKRRTTASHQVMSDEKKLCSTCRTEMDQLIDIIRPETIAGLPPQPADGSTVTGSRLARYVCPECRATEFYLKGRGTWTIHKHVSVQ
jgi:hypothetical protein